MGAREIVLLISGAVELVALGFNLWLLGCALMDHLKHHNNKD